MHHAIRPATVGLILLAVCVGAWIPAAHGGDDGALKKLLAALSGEADPARRLQHVKRLQAMPGGRAARALARLVREDPSASVRAGAARALGFVDAENALELLLAGLREGGPRAVRAALAVAVRRRAGGPSALGERLIDERVGLLDRCLWLEALAHLDDDASKRALLAHARSKNPTLLGVAVRALAQREDAAAERAVLWKHLLMAGRTPDTLLPVLDAVESALTPALEPALRRAATFLEPAIQEAALALLDRLRFEQARAEAGAKAVAPEGRYAKGGSVPGEAPPPAEPPARARVDFVYVLDATGSTNATLPVLRRRILGEMQLLARAGVSVRVGLVVYRGGRSAAQRSARFQVLPLGFGHARVRTFLDGLDAGGVDDRGASVARGLHEALARMNWRWSARRSVHLFADSRCEDTRLARRTVGIHFRADRTRTRIVYVLRTRTRMPPEYAELARLGGTGAPELLE